MLANLIKTGDELSEIYKNALIKLKTRSLGEFEANQHCVQTCWGMCTTRTMKNFSRRIIYEI